MVKMSRVEEAKDTRHDGVWKKSMYCPAHERVLYVESVRLHKQNGDIQTIAFVNACPNLSDKGDNAAHACGELTLTPIAPAGFTTALWLEMQNERYAFRRFNCCEMGGKIVTYSTKHPHRKDDAPLPPQDEHNSAKANAYQPEPVELPVTEPMPLSDEPDF